jgi:endonuclease-3|tara:strand:- start:69 stop:725 length:657 start_codon:yes stop_codon:yes gene_type:complete
MKQEFPLALVVRRLKSASSAWTIPFGIRLSQSKNPFWVLIGAVLSLRTRDLVTEAAFNKLIRLGDNASSLAKLEESQVSDAIYPVAFYQEKAKNLKSLSESIIRFYGGEPPRTIEELLTLRGVGRKTANMVLTLGYGQMGICVDAHVHRIVNRWGYVKTKNPDGTEMALRGQLPERYWKDWNRLLVTLGQNCCKPVSPFCRSCCIEKLCPKLGVVKFR